MAMTVRQLAKGPALGDFVDRVRDRQRIALLVFGALALAFVVIAVIAPLVGLLLLAFLLMCGVAAGLYSRRQVHGHGRLAHHRGQRR